MDSRRAVLFDAFMSNWLLNPPQRALAQSATPSAGDWVFRKSKRARQVCRARRAYFSIPGRAAGEF
jgi:hypothetical protein